MSWESTRNNSDTGCLPAFLSLMFLSWAVLVLIVIAHFVLKFW